MRALVRSALHAGSLLRHLGARRFLIVVVFWLLRRHRGAARALGWVFGRSAEPSGAARDPVLVYQMAKVGSTSLAYSLQFAYVRAGLAEVPVYHAHALAHLDLHDQHLRATGGSAERFALLDEYRRLRVAFDRDPAEQWNVISVVRDPVARHVSDFFHHLDDHLPGWRPRWQAGTLPLGEVVERFLSTPDHAPYWFDAEIKPALGIDVFAEPFEREAGYQLYARAPKVTLLVVRLEDLNRVATPAVERLLGLKRFRLDSFNAGTERVPTDLYDAFKRQPLPQRYLDSAYGSAFARHFYTPAELDRFARRWGGSAPAQ